MRASSAANAVNASWVRDRMIVVERRLGQVGERNIVKADQGKVVGTFIPLVNRSSAQSQ